MVSYPVADYSTYREQFMMSDQTSKCPHGCHSNGDCCACCIYIDNLDVDEVREMHVTEEYLRIETDKEYRNARRIEYDKQQSTGVSQD